MSSAIQLSGLSKVSLRSAGRSLEQQLKQFRGQVDPRAAVLHFIEEQAARKGEPPTPGGLGPEGLKKTVALGLAQPISDYLALIIKIGEAMSDEVVKEFPAGEVRIAQVRASFDFNSWLVKVMFVIDSEKEGELRISHLLSQLENIVLHSDCFAVELDYVNKRTRKLDCESLRRRYPFVAKVRPGV